MAGETAETEKVEKQPSESSPKSLHEGLERFARDQAAKPSEEAVKAQPEGKPEETLEKKDEECPECEKEKQEKARAEAEKAAAAPKPKWFLTDESGKQKIPFGPIKADGKEYDWETPEKLSNWASLGIHSNTRLEELKKAEGMLGQIMDAIQQGRVEVKDGKLIATPTGKARVSEAKATEEPGAESGDEDYLSPEVRETRQELRAVRAELTEANKKIEVIGQAFAQGFFEKEKASLDGEIAKFKPKFPLAKEKDIWDLLKIVENEQPKYSVEQAMQKAHEEHLADFTRFRDEHPEFVGKTEIIAQYLKEKGDKESAPVSKPSPETTTSPKVERKPYANMGEGISAFMKDQEKALRAKEKF